MPQNAPMPICAATIAPALPDCTNRRNHMIGTSKIIHSTSTSLRLAVVAAVFSLLLVTPALRAQGSEACSNATMHGVYAFSGSGYSKGAPLAVTGEVIYDGEGKGKIVTETVSAGGTIYKGITGTGNFTV